MRCSDTLEYLNVRCYSSCTLGLVLHWSCDLPSSVVDPDQTFIDLPKAIKLGDVVFWIKAQNVGWGIMTLQTATSNYIEISGRPQFAFHTHPLSSVPVPTSDNPSMISGLWPVGS